MAYKVVYTKHFNGNLRNVIKDNKKAAQATRAAMTEAGTDGQISLPRTKHGESRLPNIEKYDLPDAYRLIVQLIDGINKTRAFLFVGSHADAEHWLDVHKNYKWVQDKKDGTLQFTLATVSGDKRHVPSDRLNLDLPEDSINKPILGVLSDKDWEQIGIDEEGRNVILKIRGTDFERDAEGILEKLDASFGYGKCTILFDLMHLAHSQEWEEFKQRLAVLHGGSCILNEYMAAEALTSIESNDSIITFDDKNLLDDFLSMNNLADWMLFLHPEQKIVCERDFRGPARLKGVSGSGKTSVLVHRARRLAKKYAQPVLLLTLTESMRKLLERLADDLCGAERSLIETKTMGMLVKENYASINNETVFNIHMISNEQQYEIAREVHNEIINHELWNESEFCKIDSIKMFNFIQDEISYVRGRLKDTELDTYLDTKLFQRTGRGSPLDKNERMIMYSCICQYIEKLNKKSVHDHESISSYVAKHLIDKNILNTKYRCILADEVQDLSEIDIFLIGKLKSLSGECFSEIENGLFLAGDSAQSIYKRGFSLRRVGIDIVGRGFTLNKNYRNTFEILSAAFGLIKEYEFPDIGEDSKARPFMPIFAARHGAKPLLIRCETLSAEASIVADDIASLLAMGQIPGQICIIGPSSKVRDEITKALTSRRIPHIELRNDVDYEGDYVKISTIESAKGHEFSAVYIMGLVEGVLPLANLTDEDIAKDASRFYVGMTRAREKLIITYNQNSAASRFLHTIQANCEEAFTRNGILRKVSDY